MARIEAIGPIQASEKLIFRRRVDFEGSLQAETESAPQAVRTRAVEFTIRQTSL
jgi:hypothetical protein